MRTAILTMTAAALCWAETGFCQGVFDRGSEVFRGKGEDQSSKPFTMSGPFVLSWTLIDQPPSNSIERKYRKPYSTENPAWISLRVVDAKTQEKVEWETKTGMAGNLAITRGGTFYLVATSFEHVGWAIRAKEGKLQITDKGEIIVPTTSADRDRAAGRRVVAPAPAPIPPAPTPANPSSEERSTWDGKGLPPGMQKR